MAPQSSIAPSISKQMKVSAAKRLTMPRGHAKNLEDDSDMEGTSRGNATRMRQAPDAAAISVTTSGDTPVLKSAVPLLAPTNVPMLKKPWKPDINGMPAARSTVAA